MKKFIFTILTIVIMATPAMAGWFVNGNLGYDIISQYDDNVAGGITAGYNFNDKVMTGLEWEYLPIDDVRDKSLFMANLKIPYFLNQNFGVYAEAGLGVDTNHRANDTAFEAGLGGIYKCNEHVSANLGYKYLTVDDETNTEFSIISAGLTYEF